jgi:hypothetical protein
MDSFDALKREAVALERQMEEKLHRMQQVSEVFHHNALAVSRCLILRPFSPWTMIAFT